MSEPLDDSSQPLSDSEAFLSRATRKPRFALGRVVATPGALRLLQQTSTDALALLIRHVSGDWGDVCAEDAQENELSLAEGFRLMSVYSLPLDGPSLGDADCQNRIWLITEADRSVTTVLTPGDY